MATRELSGYLMATRELSGYDHQVHGNVHGHLLLALDQQDVQRQLLQL